MRSGAPGSTPKVIGSGRRKTHTDAIRIADPHPSKNESGIGGRKHLGNAIGIDPREPGLSPAQKCSRWVLMRQSSSALALALCYGS
jgi:hypothetical protein